MTIDELAQKVNELEARFNSHAHTGTDSLQIMGQNVLFPVTTVAPTHAARDGTIILYVDSLTAPTVWRLYERSAKTWKYKVIDNGA